MDSENNRTGWKEKLITDLKLIRNLARNDFKTRYAGSYLGIFWAFVQPVVTILVYWFVFSTLRAGRMRDVPFILWLIAGLVPWFYFQESLSSGCTSLLEYSYLVKKVVFNIDILPAVKITSAMYVHMFFVLVTVVLYTVMGYFPGITVIGLLYYSFSMAVMVLGLSYFNCAVAVFFRDLTQIIAIILQVGVWMTPIMWNFDDFSMPPFLRYIFMANPMYYITDGYRACLIEHTWFWERPMLTLYFWIFTVCAFCLGRAVFGRLKVHFADML